MLNHLKYLTFLFVLIGSFAFGQNRFDDLKIKLEQAAQNQPGLNNKVDISVNHYTIQEIIRAIAQENQLNVSIDANLDTRPSYNFANATVKDVFLLLCKEHDLTLEWTGQIISFKTYQAPKEKPKFFVPKVIDLRFNSRDSTFSGSLRNDTLFNVIGKLSGLANVNIDLAPSLRNDPVSMVIVNQKLGDVLTRLAGENELKKISKNFYQIKKKEEELEISSASRDSRNTNRSSRGSRSSSNRNQRRSGDNDEFTVEVFDDSLISVEAIEGDLKELVSEVCKQSGNNFFLFDEPKGKISLSTNKLKFEETLSYLLNTSDYTYKKIDSVYIIGDRNKEKFRHTETYQFQYRTIEGIPDFIPADLKKGIEIQESVELNSLILSGALPQINELKKFFQSIDKVVPMVLIEVMIVDINRSKTIETGLSLLSDGNGTGTGGSYSSGGANVQLNSSTLNRIISSINNLGYFNLGNIGSQFYVSMNAMETDGLVKIVSTPKLAALNGHEAEMSIGDVEYYKETSNNYVGTQISQTVQSFVYKPLNADLSVNIKPVVSGDDQITLEISVSQSSFTGRLEPGAPPGSQKREFKSIIRMKNQEMVVLGGLDDKKNEKSSAGVPILSRIPVIKWFFGTTKSDKSKSELTIFIRPTVIQ